MNTTKIKIPAGYRRIKSTSKLLKGDKWFSYAHGGFMAVVNRLEPLVDEDISVYTGIPNSRTFYIRRKSLLPKRKKGK